MTPRQADVYIAVGSNIAPAQNIPAAVRKLAEVSADIAVSHFYQTKPLGRPEQADYRNGVVRIRVALEREALERDLLKAIESDLGRVRTEDRYASRTIDLDLAVYEKNGEAAWVDAEVYERNFIAIPLAELAPDMRLPNGTTALHNARALGQQGLIADDTLTQSLQELVQHESRTH